MTTFQKAIKQYLDSGNNLHRKLAKHFEIIPATVIRWANGEAEPLPGMKKLVLKWIEKQ